MSDPAAPAPAPEPAPVPDPAIQQPPPQAAPLPQAAGPRPARRVLGIQPVLLVGIVLLTLVTLLTIVLIFVGDIGSQAPRVVWTVIAFGGFTGLLALDLALARRSSVPLVIGVAANVYLLAILMLATWVEPIVVTPPETICDPVDGCDYADPDRYGPPLGIALLGVYLLAFVVVRAAAAGAWALVELGRRGVLPVARVVGLVAAALLGLAAVLLTLHLAITPFGIGIDDLYWRVAVAVVVLAALAACITTLLYWSRRQLEPRPEPQAPVAAAAHAQQQPRPWPAPPAQQQPWPQQQGWPQQGWPPTPQPQQPPFPGPPWPGQPWPQHDPAAQGAVPNPMQPPPQQQPPHPPHPQQPPQQG